MYLVRYYTFVIFIEKISSKFIKANRFIQLLCSKILMHCNFGHVNVLVCGLSES